MFQLDIKSLFTSCQRFVFNEVNDWALSVTSHASSLYLVFVLSKCPKLKIIDLGTNNGLTDQSIIKVLLQNPLTMLEEFHCERNTDFTLGTINLLVNNCDNLKALSDLQSWTGIDPGDLREQSFISLLIGLGQDIYRTINLACAIMEHLLLRHWYILTSTQMRREHFLIKNIPLKHL